MPFSKSSEHHDEEYWERHFENFLKPLIEQDGQFEASRSTAVRGDVLRQIVSDLVSSPVVVADITDHNPNVFWELGIRQSFRHGTITIAESGTRLPFDIFSKGTLFYYPRDHVKNQGFIASFRKALKDCNANPDFPDSPVVESVAGRGTLYDTVRKEESKRRLEAAVSEANYNREIRKAVYSQVAENAGIFGKKVMTVARFRKSCVELLLTHRYASASAEFYSAAETYHAWLLILNEQLLDWKTSARPTQKWLLEYREKGEGFFANYEKQLAALFHAVSSDV